MHSLKAKMLLLLAVITASGYGVHAQVVVKHLKTEKSPIANGVWAGDTLYLSGQLASPGHPGRFDEGCHRGLRRYTDAGAQCPQQNSGSAARAGFGQ